MDTNWLGFCELTFETAVSNCPVLETLNLELVVAEAIGFMTTFYRDAAPKIGRAHV